ncbi:MAG: hypothetical protein F8N39_11730 [Clostridiaceae bacterium]|nr:hypothetical protein [Clostridiaceae bacterium]
MIPPSIYLRLAGGLLVAVLIGAVVWYVGNLRTEVADGRAQIAAKDATISELGAAHQADLQAIADLRVAQDRAEVALTADSGRQQAITRTVTQIKERIVHVPVAVGACRALDSRDFAVLDGVRRILAGPAGGGDSNGADPAPGGADGRHSSPGDPGKTGQSR